tara:strand:- start:125 stop:583 length:459 start_codon:yes stop_codon:yes gene_type:complete
MRLHQLKYTTIIDADIEQVWNFFSNPKNLEELTPKNMKFEIKNTDDTSMYAGKLIAYNITPLARIPMTWVTEITQHKQQDYFIDEQRFGPYKFWHHLHKFIEEEGKTKMIDEVSFAYYGGFIGDLVQHSLITKRIKDIFQFRTKKISDLFQT